MPPRTRNPGDAGLRALEQRALYDPSVRPRVHAERARRGLPLVADETFPAPIRGLPAIRRFHLPNGYSVAVIPTSTQAMNVDITNTAALVDVMARYRAAGRLIAGMARLWRPFAKVIASGVIGSAGFGAKEARAAKFERGVQETLRAIISYPPGSLG
jgi:hypothetical protein